MTRRPLPIIQSIPHAGLQVPDEVRGQLAIGEVELYNDADLWADRHFDFGHPELIGTDSTYGAPLGTVIMPIFRGLIDVNRRADDLENPDGPVKMQSSYGRDLYRTPLDETTRLSLLHTYYDPYHAELDALVRRHAGETRLFLDCHSMAQHGPSAYAHPGAVRPLICLANLGDEAGEPRPELGVVSCPPTLLRRSAALAEELFADLALLEPVTGEEVPVVMLNWPFSGGVILRNYVAGVYGPPGHHPRPPGIMVEVNRGLLVGDQTATTPIRPHNDTRLAAIRRRLHSWTTRTLALLVAEDSL